MEYALMLPETPMRRHLKGFDNGALGSPILFVDHTYQFESLRENSRIRKKFNGNVPVDF